MTEVRKKALKSLILLFVPYCIGTVFVFFLFFGCPPIAFALPSAIWTYYGFMILHFITQTNITENWKVWGCGINFFFVLTTEFVLWSIIEPDALFVRVIEILLFSITCVFEIVFWILFLKKYFKTFREDFYKKGLPSNV